MSGYIYPVSVNTNPHLRLPSLVIATTLHQQIREVALSAMISPERAVEVQLYGYVEQIDPSVYTMSTDAGLYVPGQRVSRNRAYTQPTAFRPMNQHFRENGFDNPNCQIHSHVTDQAVFSDIDLATAETFMRSTLYPWFVWVVVNVQGEVSARLELRNPRLGIPMDVWISDPAFVVNPEVVSMLTIIPDAKKPCSTTPLPEGDTTPKESK